MKIKEAYAFDDVLMEPRFTEISSRDVVLRTKLTKKITLNVPIISANMLDVTESEMAIFMAKSGGIGVIHRFLSIEKQAEEVRKVKRTKSTLIDNPYTVLTDSAVIDAEKIMEINNVSRLPVIGKNGKLAGIITKNDISYFLGLHEDGYVAEAMTKKIITADRNILLDEAKKIMCTHHIKALPLVDAGNHLNGLITLKDINEQNIKIVLKDEKGQLIVAAAIGIQGEEERRAKALLDAGADVLVMDTAQAHSKKAFDFLKLLKKKFPGVEIICGNIATKEATLDFIKAGADGLKVGIGPGSVCTTRIVTGSGVPQLTAIGDCSDAAKKSGVPIIADGGIRNSGDLAKALAAGGDTAMLGNLLAGSDESPGDIIVKRGVSYKRYMGMASRGAAEEKAKIDNSGTPIYREPEGERGETPYKGSAKNILDSILQLLCQSMANYQGAKNIKILQNNVKFVHISGAGLQESYPHDIKLSI